MSLRHRGIFVGAVVGFLVGIQSSANAPTQVASQIFACALIGWVIGRYMEMRKPRG